MTGLGAKESIVECTLLFGLVALLSVAAHVLTSGRSTVVLATVRSSLPQPLSDLVPPSSTTALPAVLLTTRASTSTTRASTSTTRASTSTTQASTSTTRTTATMTGAAPKQKGLEICRPSNYRRLLMNTNWTFMKRRINNLHREDKQRQDYGKLSNLVPTGVNAKIVVYLPGMATYFPPAMLLRERHRTTWMTQDGVCSPARHREAGCVIFPVFTLNYWTKGNEVFRGPCDLTGLKDAQYLAAEENLASIGVSETVIIHGDDPLWDPRWDRRHPYVRTMAVHTARTRFILRFIAHHYPWFSHLVRQDLDAYIFWCSYVQMLVRNPAGKAAATGHVFLGVLYSRGHRSVNKRCSGGQGGGCNREVATYRPEAQEHLHFAEDRYGNSYLAVQFSKVMDTWCNYQTPDPLLKWMDKRCETIPGLCSGFIWGATYGVSASLVRAVLEDGWLDLLPLRNEDVELSRVINRIALNKSQEVELRLICVQMKAFVHFR